VDKKLERLISQMREGKSVASYKKGLSTKGSAKPLNGKSSYDDRKSLASSRAGSNYDDAKSVRSLRSISSKVSNVG
jgi:hypothetical protein